ncbi:MAG TPA: CPBP family intramembrane metalloprotease [Defluviitaleaceae bacterium]|nr:CPBP family intramembrane metalloprotease [Defluviitaleaceae bacterium]
MNVYLYENWNLNRTKYDLIREFCLCEKVDEEYFRSIIKRNIRRDRGVIKMGKVKVGRKKVLLSGAVILLLLILQKVLGIAGSAFADMFSFEKIDPYKAFAWNFVHHITMLILTLFVILILKKLFSLNFGFGLGDSKTGTKFVAIYTPIIAGVSLVVHILMMVNNSLPVYAYPLNKSNIIGTLCFQLFLTGPAEELLYRALPITTLVKVFGKNIEVKWGITLESIIASFLFAFAHMKWSLFPFAIEMDYFQFLYAFAQGIISGKAYQDSRSVIYPMLMHSISNVLMVGTGYLFLLI